ncbi:MAG: AraC family transcriptional regulator [Prevotella sp.]|nr:AraC family transcriptional regulator [Prevotella sp.]
MVTGLTAANYILAVRMDEAKRLLAEYPKYNISEVAHRCGFADNAHFGHAFKRVFKTTPLEFAKGKM